jgi:ABC-2 type transport system ATP-binding protein
VWQYLRMLRDEEGVSVLVTTHLMEEAEHCDRLAILSEGKLVALGSPFELKSEIGGDIVTFETADQADAEALSQKIANRYILSSSVLGNSVRLEHRQGHKFVAEVVEAFPGMVEGISVAKPSLEDVFIQRTGHRFWTERESA